MRAELQPERVLRAARSVNILVNLPARVMGVFLPGKINQAMPMRFLHIARRGRFQFNPRVATFTSGAALFLVELERISSGTEQMNVWPPSTTHNDGELAFAGYTFGVGPFKARDVGKD